MISQQLINAHRAGRTRRHTFASFFLDSGPYHFCDSQADIEYDGVTYLATGLVGRVEFNDTTVSRLSGALKMTLSGAFVGEDGADLSDDMQQAITKTLTGEPLQDRAVTVFTAITDLEATQVLFDPNLKRSGIIDTVSAAEDDDGFPTIELTVEDRGRASGIVSPRSYTLESHRLENAGSTLYEQSAVLDAKDINWGKNR